MDGDQTSPRSSMLCSFMEIFFSFSISTGVLLQFGAPSDKTVNYLPLFMATLTLYLGTVTILLWIHLTAKPLNPTSTCLINHAGTATLAASFSTLVLTLPEASAAFTNSTLFSSGGLISWAPEWGLILLAIAVLCKLINDTPTSWSLQSIKVALFSLCAAFAGLCTTPLGPLASTTPYNSVIYHFGLVPCAFVFGALLLILGIATTDSSANPFALVIFKRAFTMLTLSVGCITLLIGVSLTVHSSAMVEGVGGVGAV